MMKKPLKRTLSLLLSLALVLGGVGVIPAATTEASSTGYTELTFSDFGIEDGTTVSETKHYAIQDTSITSVVGTAFSGKISFAAATKYFGIGGPQSGDSHMASIGIREGQFVIRDFQVPARIDVMEGSVDTVYDFRITFDQVDAGVQVTLYLDGVQVAQYVSTGTDTTPNIKMAAATVYSVHVGQEEMSVDSIYNFTASGDWRFNFNMNGTWPTTGDFDKYTNTSVTVTVKSASGETLATVENDTLENYKNGSYWLLVIWGTYTKNNAPATGDTITISSGQLAYATDATKVVNFAEEMVLEYDGANWSVYEEKSVEEMTVGSIRNFTASGDWRFNFNMNGTWPTSGESDAYTNTSVTVTIRNASGETLATVGGSTLENRKNGSYWLLVIWGSYTGSNTPAAGDTITISSGQLAYADDANKIVNFAEETVLKYDGANWSVDIPIEWTSIAVNGLGKNTVVSGENWKAYFYTDAMLPGESWGVIDNQHESYTFDADINGVATTLKVRKAGDQLLYVEIPTANLPENAEATVTFKAGKYPSNLQSIGYNLTEDFVFYTNAYGWTTVADAVVSGVSFTLDADATNSLTADGFILETNVDDGVTPDGSGWTSRIYSVCEKGVTSNRQTLYFAGENGVHKNGVYQAVKLPMVKLHSQIYYVSLSSVELSADIEDYYTVGGVFVDDATGKFIEFEPIHVKWNGQNWESVTEAEIPSVISITGIQDVGNDEKGAYATLTISGQMEGSGTGETTERSVTVLRDGVESTVMIQRSGSDTLFVRTPDDLSALSSPVEYVISERTKIDFADNACLIEETFTFYVTKDGISAYLPLNIGFQNCEIQEENNRWKLTVNISPEIKQTGILGSASALLQEPGKDVASVTIEKIYVGDISTELICYLDYETVGKPSELPIGTQLTIQEGMLNEELSIHNEMVLTWNGTNWTDLANADDIVGDANGDGGLDVRDLVRYYSVLADKNSFATDYVSDLNKDMKTNAFDTTLMRRILLGETEDTISFQCVMDVTSPIEGEVVYPYIDKVYDFLTTEGADIWDYYVQGSQPGRDGSLKDLTITWNGVYAEEESQYVDKYVVEYATKEDFTDAVVVATDENLTSVNVNNLYKASDYYVRVTAYAGNIVLGRTEEITFKTTDTGPRLMTVDGIYNVRDLGGYMTESGKRTAQGLIYRGSEMNTEHELTEAGDYIMSNLMGIKLDMDFRTLEESNNITESPISSAIKIHYPIGAYTDVLGNTYKEYMREIFATFADESNYPIYFHCKGGADRTGTIAFLLNGLCGVSETELRQDYEMTSFSVFGVRADEWDEYNFAPFVEQLKTYEGDTLSEKIENYLISIGVTIEEISNIRAIMFGEVTVQTGQ